MSNRSNNSTPPLIELHNASVMRGDQVVIKDMSLRIEVGEHVAILGPNGCGKSTLVRTLAREFFISYSAPDPSSVSSAVKCGTYSSYGRCWESCRITSPRRHVQ